MADAKSQANRPLSPHLQIYKPMLTMMMSIVHRITGAALYFGTLLLAWWLIAAVSGPEYFDYVNGLAGTLIGIVALSLWAAAVASDYSTGWVRLLVAAEPRRWRLLVGKLVALSGFTIVATVVATAIVVALSYLQM